MTPTRIIARYANDGRAYRRWYVHARLVVKQVATWTDTPVEHVADVLALTSPRCAVTRNLKVTYAYLQGDGFPVDVVRGTRTAVEHWERTGEIRGPKTGAFAKVLRGDDSVCVVDSHIARAFGYDGKVARSMYVRGPIGNVIRRLARRFGWDVAGTQAAIWAGYYRQTYPHGKVPMYDTRMVVPF
jgi:hypothetical protein